MRLKNISLNTILPQGIVLVVCGAFALPLVLFAQTLADAGVPRTPSLGVVTRVAPGEAIPISVKLVNFGLMRRADVRVDYTITDNKGNRVVSETETVAVETTASFVKEVSIPFGTPPGTYTAAASILYESQEVPAIAKFTFTIERKFFGFFISDLLLYGAATLVIAALCVYMTILFVRRRRATHVVTHEYADHPKDVRIYYEIVSDTIAQMRLRVGDDALEIAKGIPDLVIDENTGRVLDIRKDPAKIIALLVLRFETLLGRKVNLAPRQEGVSSPRPPRPAVGDVRVVREYFE